MTALDTSSPTIRFSPQEIDADLLEDGESSISFELLTHVGSVLKTLGHPSRLQIIRYLALGEQCVSDIQAHIGLSQPSTSQQLRIMADKNILARRRDGNVIYYRVANEFIWKILDCMQTLSAKLDSGEWSLEQIGVVSKETHHERSS